MALHVAPIETPAETRERIVELVGRAQSRPTTDTAVIADLQQQAVGHFVEMVRLRTAIADKDRRIATLSVGLRTWRERAQAEAELRRHEAAEAVEREREIVSLLHQQMQVADAATAELERTRALPWWRRLSNR